MPISLMKQGDKVRVMNMGGDAVVKKHLGDLGLIPGALVTVMSSVDGDLIVALKDSRIALDRTLARRIFVEPAA